MTDFDDIDTENAWVAWPFETRVKMAYARRRFLKRIENRFGDMWRWKLTEYFSGLK